MEKITPQEWTHQSKNQTWQDGKPVMVGFVPKIEAVKDAIKQTIDNQKSGCCQSADCKCDKNCC